MKKFFAVAAAVAAFGFANGASAADMPAKVPVYKATKPIFDWTGFYVGSYVGVGVQRSHGFDSTGLRSGEVEYIGSGFAGGGTIGYNWQLAKNWVAGIEGDLGYLGLSNNFPTYFSPFRLDSKTSALATLRGRVGYSNGPTLSYITAGGAWVRTEDLFTLAAGAFPTTTSTRTLGGFTVGSGVETMLGGNWTAKAEYLYVDAGHGDPVFVGAPCVCNVEVDKHRYDLMKFGVNYLFGGKPQPALSSYNWGGFYAGFVGGRGVSQSRVRGFGGGVVGDVGINEGGFTVGGLAGFNWQFAPHWVAGVEGDFSWLGISDSHQAYNNGFVFGLETNWLGTARGRIGYSTGPALLYVTGGGAWVNLDDKFDVVSSTKTLSGYTGGGGIETVLSGNWTTRAEYLFVDVGDGPALTSGFTTTANHKFHVFRSALIYRFGTQ